MAHVEKRGKGSYRLVVTIGYNDKGTPIRERKTIKAKNTTEAKKQLAIYESEILTGKYIKTDIIKLEELFVEWLDKEADNKFTPKTKENYINIYNQRIRPLYGHMKVTDIKPIHVLNFVNSLSKDGARLDGKPGSLSASSINNAYKAFNALLRFAYELGWASENAATNIKPPTPQKTETEVYSIKEIKILMGHLEKEPFHWQLIILLALISAARQGEIAALEEKHVDFERGGIHIKQSLSNTTKEGLKLKSTKTGRQRFVSLPDQLMNYLRKQIHVRKQESFKAGQFQEWPDHLFLFANEFGKPLRADRISKWWRKFIGELNINKIRFHDLRHTSSTLLINDKVHAKVISQRLGHADISTTMNIYGHVMEEVDKETASYFDLLFESPQK